jgi:hypothetical protein
MGIATLHPSYGAALVELWRTSCSTRERAWSYSAASLALLLFLGLPSAFFSTGAKNLPV